MNKKLVGTLSSVDQNKIAVKFHEGRFFTVAQIEYTDGDKHIISEGVARRSVLAPKSKKGKPAKKISKEELPTLLKAMSRGRAFKSLLMKLNHEIPRDHYMG